MSTRTAAGARRSSSWSGGEATWQGGLVLLSQKHSLSSRPSAKREEPGPILRSLSLVQWLWIPARRHAIARRRRASTRLRRGLAGTTVERSSDTVRSVILARLLEVRENLGAQRQLIFMAPAAGPLPGP